MFSMTTSQRSSLKLQAVHHSDKTIAALTSISPCSRRLHNAFLVFRNGVAWVSLERLPFRFLCSSPFSRDPLADIRWAIAELEAVRFAAPKETDSVLIH